MRLAGATPPDLREHAQEELGREREEASRVLYVAATRARDLLVVPAVGDGEQQGWLDALNPVIYPDAGLAPTPRETRPRGCPAFGDDTVPQRPANVPRPAASVVPGLHAPRAGTHGVVWWDPRALELGVQESVGLTQQKLLTADESGERSERGIHAHAEWQAQRARARREAGAPSIVVATATEAAAELSVSAETSSGAEAATGAEATAAAVASGAISAAIPAIPAIPAAPKTPTTPAASASLSAQDARAALLAAIADYEAAVIVEDASAGAPAPAVKGASRKSASAKAAKAAKPGKAGAAPSGFPAPPDNPTVARTGGIRFGTLVHAVLAAIDLDADEGKVRAAADLYARLLGSEASDAEDASRAAVRALAHPLMRRAAQAARSGRCRRETALTATLPDGRILEGAADAAFFEDGSWTVVDFKTDADLARGLDAYRRQVALYAWAIARATGLPARGVVFKV
jgi:ATP-dependent exoDNAse (exonuclease V) beta subunit